MTASRFAVDEVTNSTEDGPVSFPTGISASIASNIRGSEGGGTITLTSSDLRSQVFTLTAAESVKLPSTGVPKGDTWEMINPQPFKLSVKANDGSVIQVAYGMSAIFKALIANPLTSSDWVMTDFAILYAAAAQPWTPVTTLPGIIDGASVHQWRRNGLDSIYMRGDIGFTGAGAHTPFGVPLPNGYTFKTAYYTSTFGGTVSGKCNLFTTVSELGGLVGQLDATHIAFYPSGASTVPLTLVFGDNTGIVAGSGISYQAEIFVSEFT